ncbi:hypothetical protein [Stutzerimonas nitrititolerans]|uniref:hypothetical protein n=1 Tax=Stutzerimonas nitrititolerans TaxID=2482751 RepID=UPI0028A8B9A5|nr:hypothetical protein [Stutzerimonas nitrititolerans]
MEGGTTSYVNVCYQSDDSSNEYPSILQVAPLCVPSPASIPNLVNAQLGSVWVSLRLQHLNSQWMKVLGLFDDRDDYASYVFSLESMLISMKRVIDDLIMCAYCLLEEDAVLQTKKIEVDGWGVLFKRGVPTELGQRLIDKFIGQYDEFPNILNELVNALKHSFLMGEARTEWNNSFPLVKGIYAERNNYSKVVRIHNHDARQLVLGFNRIVKQLLVGMHPHSVGGVLPLSFN